MCGSVVLSNDHKAISFKIEQLLEQLHAASRQPTTQHAAATAAAAAAAAPQSGPSPTSPSDKASLAGLPHTHGAQAGAGPTKDPEAIPPAARAATATAPAAMFSVRLLSFLGAWTA